MRKHWRIIVATLFSAGCIIAAFYLAHSFDRPGTAEASTETALLQQLASKDSDHDGLPDWEEALYGTDPNNPDTFNLGMTDGEAVAKGLIVPKAVADIPAATSTPALDPTDGLPTPAQGSLTAALVQDFMAQYEQLKEQNNGADLTQDDINNIATQSLQDVLGSVTVAPDFKSMSDLNVTGSGATALTAYVANVENIFKLNQSGATSSELIYMRDAATKTSATDSFDVKELAAISKSYRVVATGIAALPVPQEVSQADLEFVNSLARLSSIIGDFSRIDSDPISAMVALSQYISTVQSIQQALIDLDGPFATDAISIPTGMPGNQFLGLLTKTAAAGPLVVPDATTTTAL